MRDRFIPKIPDKTVISIRLENELIASIDDFSKHRKMSRNEFIKQCIVFAMNRLDGDIAQETPPP